MIGFVFLRDEARGRKLVESGFFESDGERPDVLGGFEHHGRDDRARVESSAEECAEWDVGDHSHFYRLVENFAETIASRSFGEIGGSLFGGRGERPIFSGLDTSVDGIAQPSAGRKFAD